MGCEIRLEAPGNCWASRPIVAPTACREVWAYCALYVCLLGFGVLPVLDFGRDITRKRVVNRLILLRRIRALLLSRRKKAWLCRECGLSSALGN